MSGMSGRPGRLSLLTSQAGRRSLPVGKACISCHGFAPCQLAPLLWASLPPPPPRLPDMRKAGLSSAGRAPCCAGEAASSAASIGPSSPRMAWTERFSAARSSASCCPCTGKMEHRSLSSPSSAALPAIPRSDSACRRLSADCEGAGSEELPSPLGGALPPSTKAAISRKSAMYSCLGGRLQSATNSEASAER